MYNLTNRQQQIYSFIKECLELTGMPPTRVEIAKKLGFKSPNAAEEHLKALQRKGAIEILAGTSRGIRLLREEKQPQGLPLIGRVAAGEPILAEQHIEDYLEVATNIFKPNADYLLRVYGMSMYEKGILDGDYVAIHNTKEARNGQIIVARIEDDVTVKRFERKKNMVYLHPANPDFSVIKVDLSVNTFSIEGLVVGVIRNNI